jgi:uncharacterized protein YceK
MKSLKLLLLLVAVTSLQGCATVMSSGSSQEGFWDRYERAVSKVETCGINLSTAFVLAPIKGVDMGWDDICSKEWFAKQGGSK